MFVKIAPLSVCPTKNPPRGGFFKKHLCFNRFRNDRQHFDASLVSVELYFGAGKELQGSRDHRVQGIVLCTGNIEARQIFGSTLADQDLACADSLAVLSLYS